MFDRVEPRERRTIAIGAGVLLAALVVSYVVLPVARRWSDREDAIAAARDRIARVSGLLASSDQIIARAASDRPAGRHVLRARTTALAAATLQDVLQAQARLSRVSITQLDVASVDDSASAASNELPATMSAVTDIYGLADLLTRLQQHDLLLRIHEVSVSSNAVLRGELLQVALSVRAPVLLDAP